jgi:TolB-like protein/Tfp pilus assembly protein PilF
VTLDAVMGIPTKHIYEFGVFRLDAAERVLLRNGISVPLTPKVFDTLAVLVRKSGHVVGKDELMNEIWPDSFVEESNLTQNIFILRKVLGVTAEGQPYIQTVSKRGYRFVASVREVPAGDNLAAGKRVESGAIVENDALNSLAVLPLVNASANPEAEYLSDGITESIINGLSKLPQLRVMSRSTVFRYKGTDTDPQDVGQDLGVRAVLVGRVLQISDRLIVRTELVDVAKGWQVWGEQYNRKLTDILALQEDIAREISENLKIKLTGEEKQRLAKRYTEDSEAYRLYLKGRYYWNKYTKEGLTRAIEYFNHSIELDPGYALAYAGLADAYYRLSSAYAPPREVLPKARNAAIKALENDDTLAEAHASLGLIKFYFDWDWSGAEHHYKRALELDPRSVLAHQRYGSYLATMGRVDESIAILERGQALDPLSLPINSLLGFSLYASRQYDKSIDQYRRTVDMDPNYLQARFGLGFAYTQKGMYEEAIEELQKARDLGEDLVEAVAELGYVYAISGQKRKAEDVLAQLDKRSKKDYISPYNMAKIHLGLGETDLAFEWLEKAYQERSEWLSWLKVDPKLDSIRSDARFHALMKRVGLELK